jgi:hypothetical protein
MLSKINSNTFKGYSMLIAGSLLNFLFFKRLVDLLDEDSLKTYSVIILVLGILSALILLRFPVKILVSSEEHFDLKLSQSLSVMYTSCFILWPLTCVVLIVSGHESFILPVSIWLFSQPSISFDSVYRRLMRFDLFGATTLLPSLFLYIVSFIFNISEIDKVLQLLALTELFRFSLRVYFNAKLGIRSGFHLQSIVGVYGQNIKEYRYALPELLIKRFLTSFDVWIMSTLPNIQGYSQYRYTREIGSYFIKMSDMCRILVLPYLRKSREPKRFIYRLKVSSLLIPFILAPFIYFSGYFVQESNKILLCGFLFLASAQVIWPLVYYKNLGDLANKITMVCYGLSMLVFILDISIVLRSSLYILTLGITQLLWITSIRHDS